MLPRGIAPIAGIRTTQWLASVAARCIVKKMKSS